MTSNAKSNQTEKVVNLSKDKLKSFPVKLDIVDPTKPYTLAVVSKNKNRIAKDITKEL